MKSDFKSKTRLDTNLPTYKFELNQNLFFTKANSKLGTLIFEKGVLQELEINFEKSIKFASNNFLSNPKFSHYFVKLKTLLSSRCLFPEWKRPNWLSYLLSCLLNYLLMCCVAARCCCCSPESPPSALAGLERGLPCRRGCRPSIWKKYVTMHQKLW